MTNQEKYKTAQERAVAFHEYCEATYCARYSDDAFCWLELEAPAEEPLPCPFCGGEMNFGGLISSCSAWGECKCGYQTRAFISKEEAIAAHNRVARAAKGGEQ